MIGVNLEGVSNRDFLQRIANGYLVLQAVLASPLTEPLEDYFGHAVKYGANGRVSSVGWWDYAYWNDGTLQSIDEIKVGIGRRGLERIDGLPVRLDPKSRRVSVDNSVNLSGILDKYVRVNLPESVPDSNAAAPN